MIEELLTNDTLERFTAGRETSAERETLISLAANVLGRTLIYTCRNCYIDIFTELIRLYRSDKETFYKKMEEKRYKLKRGMCFQLGFGSGRMIVFQNCTDELAIEFLSINETNAQYFDVLPENWKDEVESFKVGSETTKTDTIEELTAAEKSVIEEMKSMLSEGKTKKAIKETYVKFEAIGEKKVSNRYIDSLIKEASK